MRDNDTSVTINVILSQPEMTDSLELFFRRHKVLHFSSLFLSTKADLYKSVPVINNYMHLLTSHIASTQHLGTDLCFKKKESGAGR